MIYETPCPECEGSGGIIKARTNRGELILHPLNHCPNCKGSGGFNLGVECDHTKPSSDKPNAPWIHCSPDGSKEKCLECHGKGYTLLTVAEVEEILENNNAKAMLAGSFKALIDAGELTYKGQRVKLMPREG